MLNIHVVQRGDTLWSIANQYGSSPQRILTDNGLNGPGSLVVGQALLVLTPEVVYTVRPGDTLAGIAENYGVSVMQLLQRNPDLIRSRTIRPGQQITITVTEGPKKEVEITGYAYPHIDREVLYQTLPYLTVLVIFGYGFTEEGELIEIDDQPLIDLALQFKVAPYMLLSSITEDGNFSGERASILFRNQTLQDQVIDRIIAVMKEKGYYGLDVDFEYIEPEDAEYYFSFLRNITQRMHAEGFLVNVDLAPKVSASQRGLLYEAHDYGEIGIIVDTVLLMTYEWGYTYGPPMAVAPVNRVREVVEYAVTEIPVNKILMGIPNYGYDWTLPFEQGISRATSIGNQYAVQLAARYGAEIQFDALAQSPYFNYWDSSGAKHVVWFEDVRSIQAKYGLVTEFDLRGVGYWNVMRPFVQNWSYLAADFDIAKIVQ